MFNSKGSLRVRVGPMYSGKTTWLTSETSELANNDFKIIKILHTFDLARSQDSLEMKTSGYTHNTSLNSVLNTIYVSTLKDANSHNLSDYSVIAIDEAQFFPDLIEYVKEWMKTTHILVAGLDGTFKQEPFGDVLKLCPLANEFIKLSARCSACMNEAKKSGSHHNIMNMPASYSKRIIESEKEVEIGGKDKYVAVCFYHLNQ